MSFGSGMIFLRRKVLPASNFSEAFEGAKLRLIFRNNAFSNSLNASAAH
jgi:hypothetical protein